MVGKFIGGFRYVHGSVINHDGINALSWAMMSAQHNEGIQFNILKMKGDRIHSLIWSPDFDTANEPIVLASIGRGEKDKVRWYQPPYWIYHHKWQMVGEDYTGFDYEESMARSHRWTKKCKDRSRIGRQDVWFKLLKKWGMKP